MRPYNLLPIPFPKDFDPGPTYFYENFVKAFIPDMLLLMNEGIAIDSSAVEDLRDLIDSVQEEVKTTLKENPLCLKYCKEYLTKSKQKEHEEKAVQSVRTSEHYLKPYKESDMLHRTWLVNFYLKKEGMEKDQKEKWSAASLKKYNVFKKRRFLNQIINKDPEVLKNPITDAAMKSLAEYKAELWNRPREEKAKQKVALAEFNPNSAKQIAELFDMLGIAPVAFSSKTGNASWERKEIENLKGSINGEKNKELAELLDALIKNSYSAIIKNNFIKAFDTYTINGVLHGNIKLFGAKSFRNTSNSPNLLNAPSTGSIYAKPLKRCFKAKEGFVIYTADLSALEDRVLANLTLDQNKIDVFKQNLDGHSLNACGYYNEQVKKLLGMDSAQGTDLVRAFMKKIEEEDKIFEALRQDSKGPTFKLALTG